MSDDKWSSLRLEEKINRIQKSLDASYEALSRRVARLENRQEPCERQEMVCVTFTKQEAENLWSRIGVCPELRQQRMKLALELGLL